ncbi:predicted protein, partial [Nematostella vectensis]
HFTKSLFTFVDVFSPCYDSYHVTYHVTYCDFYHVTYCGFYRVIYYDSCVCGNDFDFCPFSCDHVRRNVSGYCGGHVTWSVSGFCGDPVTLSVSCAGSSSKSYCSVYVCERSGESPGRVFSGLFSVPEGFSFFVCSSSSSRSFGLPE